MNVLDIDPFVHRQASVAGVDAAFVARWSPRAMSGEPLETGSLDVLFEAARWAPSCFNAQPWCFLYAYRDCATWPSFFDCLVEGNQSWVANASALIAVLSRTHFETNDKPAPTHEFDAGAAWMSIALQAAKMNLVTHAMRGFDADIARTSLAIPEAFKINAMVAVGHPGTLDDLSESQLKREVPSGRKPIAEFAYEGVFPTQ